MHNTELSCGSKRDFDVIVVGDLNADLILGGDVVPAFGQVEKLLESATLVLGGSSAIFACGAARLGLRVAFISKVGDDVFGQFVCHELEAHQIDTTGIVIDPSAKTGLTVVLSRSADRAILTYPGAFASLQYNGIDLEFLTRARHLHMGGYFLLDALRPDIPRLFDLAHAHDLTVSLDTNYDPKGQWQIGDTLKHIDLFFPNEAEVHAITGMSDVDKGSEVLARQSPIVAVKCGEQGGLVQSETKRYRANAIQVFIIDTIGAGDSFDAGFVYAYLARKDMQQALQMGIVCGSLSTRAAGGTAGQPTLEEAIDCLNNESSCMESG